MLSRFISKSSQFQRLVTLISSQTHIVNARPIYQNSLFSNSSRNFYPKTPHFSFFSTKGNNGNSSDDSATSTTDLWKLSSEDDQDIDSVFSVGSGSPEGFNDRNGGEMKSGDYRTGDPFGGVDERGWNFRDTGTFGGVEENVAGVGNEEGATAEDQPWSFSKGKEGEEEDVFGVEAESGELGFSGLGDGLGEVISETEKIEQEKQLESEEKTLTAVLKGFSKQFHLMKAVVDYVYV